MARTPDSGCLIQEHRCRRGPERYGGHDTIAPFRGAVEGNRYRGVRRRYGVHGTNAHFRGAAQSGRCQGLGDGTVFMPRTSIFGGAAQGGRCRGLRGQYGVHSMNSGVRRRRSGRPRPEIVAEAKHRGRGQTSWPTREIVANAGEFGGCREFRRRFGETGERRETGGTFCTRALGWGARIRTWDRGTKTRCLTTWLRPMRGWRNLAPKPCARNGSGPAPAGTRPWLSAGCGAW